MSLRKLVLLFVLCCVIPGMSACSRTKIPGIKPAEGVVIYDNVPLAWATVGFVPKDPAQGRQAATQTDGEGRFALRTLGDSGALPGEYFIMVYRVIPDEGKNTLADWKRERASGVPEPEPDHDLLSSPNVKLIPVLPSKYSKPKESGVEVVIPPEGNKDIRIELK